MKNLALNFMCVFCLFGVVASANSAIVYQADDRYIDHTLGGTYTPASSYADFNEDWWAWEAGASQTSSLTSTAMSGTGSTYAGYDAMNYGAVGTSVFSVTFTVDELTNFSLAGALDTGLWDSSMSVSLVENNVEMFGIASIWDLPNDGVNPFSFDGQFVAGNVYELMLSSSSFDSDYYNESWQFDLTTSAVPVPAAVWLFGSGLLGLIGVARRKQISTK